MMAFEEILSGNPITKWKEIILHANPSVVQRELERILEELALSELEKQGIKPTKEDLEHTKQDLAIQSMGNILSQNE